VVDLRERATAKLDQASTNGAISRIDSASETHHTRNVERKACWANTMETKEPDAAPSRLPPSGAISTKSITLRTLSSRTGTPTTRLNVSETRSMQVKYTVA
jgi:hypothetical protein